MQITKTQNTDIGSVSKSWSANTADVSYATGVWIWACACVCI